MIPGAKWLLFWPPKQIKISATQLKKVLGEILTLLILKWFDLYESKAKYNIAETCAASISLQGLQDLSGDQGHKFWDFSKPLTYGSIRGSAELRSNLASLYSSEIPSPIRIDNILITPGAIAANMISFYGLIGKGDHVICHYPTYQQLYEVPASIGAEVSLWRAQKDNQWQLDVSELKSLIKPHTKMIIIKYAYLAYILEVKI